MPTLSFYREGRKTLCFPLMGQNFRVGRHSSNDLTLPDEEVSRFHATFESRSGGYWLKDQSRNGTLLNGRRVKESLLKDHDEIGISGWCILFATDAAWGEQETVVQKKTSGMATFQGMVGQSEPMRRLFGMLQKVASSPATALVIGETGSGKELVARALHNLSPRERKPFLDLNCGAISHQLIESELFGHERGAFTGADRRHSGAFEQAQGGTLFLDEIGELPLGLQPKLLRVLESRHFRRLGGCEEIVADVRVVAATHRNLERLVQTGTFREDLYFRLYAIPLFLPPLRERRSDIPLLIDYFLQNFQAAQKKSFNPEAVKKLEEHAWRGNVRELKNVITRSLLFASGGEIGPEGILFLSPEEAPPSQASATPLENAERETILAALRETQWNKAKAAEFLGIAKSTLFQKIKEYRLQAQREARCP